ncbi:hypothetical protein Tco_0345109, partial [Tanacetum coccineum]
SCLAVLGSGGAEVSLIVGAGSSSKSLLIITSHRLWSDILVHSHAPYIILSLPDDMDLHCSDCGWRNVLFCHLTFEFFLIRVYTQALIPLIRSFY